VELEVLVVEVGEDRRVVGDPSDALGGQPMRRGLEDRRPFAPGDHRPEQALEAHRPGGGHVVRRPLARPPDARLDRSDQTGRQARGFERRRHQE
jgi:hypothetical protein